MAENKPSKLHAIMISFPFQGHINPFVNLALKIASKGFTITFVHLEFIHHKLSKAHHNNKTDVDFFSEARESGLDIRYTTIGDDFPLEFDRDLNLAEYWNYWCFGEFPARVDEFVAKTIESDPCSVHFLVADIVNGWPAKIADKYKLVNAAFWTQPAFIFSLAYHWDVIREKGHAPRKGKDNMEAVEIDYVPGVESISTKDLMSYITDPDCVVADGLFAAYMDAKKADFILLNTVHELEPETISALNKYQPNYAIGPVNFYKNPSTVSKSFWPESDCANWLGSKPTGSVLYVSFGSLVQTSKKVIEEIAYGLILSEVNFIWVVRPNIAAGSCDVNVLPVGFEDEIKDRGLIVPWCNQIAVLSNPAVGGFLTHNGWNSTVESMWCGVPMICYPIAYDQFTSRKLVVEDWKIGISLCGGGDSFVGRKQVAEKIKTLMTSHGVRQEAEKVRDMLRDALQIGGSSERNFDQFVEDLKKKLTC